MRPARSASLSHLRRWIVGSCLVWSGIGATMLWYYQPGLPVVPLELPAPEPSADAPEWSGEIVIPDRLGRGETLSSLLERNGFYGDDQRSLVDALGEHIPLRRLRPGNEVEFRYASTGEPTVWVVQGMERMVRARRMEGGWLADVVERELETRLTILWGTLQGNLFDSMKALGETAPLTIAFANVLQWDFDFHSQSRPGDRFGAVVEKRYRDGELVGYGDLKAVVYDSGATRLAAVLFPDADGRREYYDFEGQSMRKAFLRAPLEFHRISSGFSHSRLHPVDGKRRPHLAIDYAANTGTPVHAVADGVVSFRARNGGAGNMVSVRHRHGYVSSYLHLSRFAKGLSKGDRVKQKQVIGYVGKTGTATGPHLDFRLRKHGRPVNPLSQIFPPGPPVAAVYRDAFERQRDVLISRLGLDAITVARGEVGGRADEAGSNGESGGRARAVYSREAGR